MNAKYLIFGATGSIGSSLANQLKKSGYDNIHLVARKNTELEDIAKNLDYTFSVADVLEDGFVEKIKAEIEDIKGIAYCVGSIDLKPIKNVTEKDLYKKVNILIDQNVNFLNFNRPFSMMVDALRV